MFHRREPVSADVWIVLITIAVIGGFVAWIFLKGTGPVKTTRELALGCTTDMATQFHIHPSLKILVDGKEEQIPAEIGIRDGCMSPLHTHDATGVIHVESPEKRDFTLGDFFVVWDRPLQREKFTVSETVNGTATRDYENTVLRDDDKIVISYQKSI